jgi:hypothetical protein
MRAIAVLLGCFISASALGITPAERLAAAREYEQAVLEWRQYDQVERPAALRQLAGDIKLSEAELASIERRLREYEPTTRFNSGGALFLDIEHLKLLKLETELRLTNVREAQAAETRFHADRVRLFELRLLSAKARYEAK